MEYYQHASRQYRTQNVWVRRCCLGVALLTAFVLSASLLSSPSSGVRSSRLVNFNGTETEYSPGMFDRLSGHFQRARDTLWSWGGFWDDLDSDEFWDDADEQAEDEGDTGLYDEAIAEDDRDLNAEAAQNDAELAAAAAARAKKAGAGMAEAKAAALAAVTAANAKPAREAAAAEAEAEFEAEGAAADAALAERAAAGAGADLPKPAGGEAGRPTAGAAAHEAAAAELAEEEAKEEAAEEAAEDALEAAADAEASLDLPARLAKTAAAGKTKAGYAAAEAAVAKENELADLAAGKDARLPALEEDALEKEEIAEEKEEAAESAWEAQEEAQESIEAAQRVGDAVRAAKLVPLAEAAGKEYEAKEADADAAFQDAQAAEVALVEAEKPTDAAWIGSSVKQ